MTMRRGIALVCLAAVLCASSIVGLAQDSNIAVPQELQQATETAVNQALTYIDSLATYLGQGVLYLLNLITDDRVSSDLEKPIGYLAFITLILLLFGLLDFARKIIWIGIIVGWVLLIVRVILDALKI